MKKKFSFLIIALALFLNFDVASANDDEYLLNPNEYVISGLNEYPELFDKNKDTKPDLSNSTTQLIIKKDEQVYSIALTYLSDTDIVKKITFNRNGLSSYISSVQVKGNIKTTYSHNYLKEDVGQLIIDTKDLYEVEIVKYNENLTPSFISDLEIISIDGINNNLVVEGQIKIENLEDFYYLKRLNLQYYTNNNSSNLKYPTVTSYYHSLDENTKTVTFYYEYTDSNLFTNLTTGNNTINVFASIDYNNTLYKSSVFEIKSVDDEILINAIAPPNYEIIPEPEEPEEIIPPYVNPDLPNIDLKTSFSLSDVVAGISSWFSSFWLIVAFSISIPLAFYIASRVKLMFID